MRTLDPMLGCRPNRRAMSHAGSGIFGPAGGKESAVAYPETTDPRWFSEFMREQLVHEDSLRNNRLNWMLLLEGLLFAGLGEASSERPLIGLILAGVGVVVSCSFAAAFQYGACAARDLKVRWDAATERNDELRHVPVMGFRHDGRRPRTRLERTADRCLHGLQPWRLLPLLFLLAWILVGVVLLTVVPRGEG